MSIEGELQRLVGPLPAGISEGVALGTGIADGFGLFESPLGEVVVAFNPLGVSAVDVADKGFMSRFTARHGRGLFPADPPAAWARRIPDAIEAGTPGLLPLDVRSVTPFQAGVLRVAATIPRGEVRSYGWVAARSDSPGATRAVGTTMATNPTPLIIPCHRVIRSDGQIGAYSLGGPENKWRLLELEGAEPSHLQELASRGIRVQGNKETGIFCYPSCRANRRSKPANVVGYRSIAEAVEDGLRPCRVCRPG